MKQTYSVLKKRINKHFTNKSNYRTLFSVLILAVFLSSCSSSIYFLNPHNVSGFEKANEMGASAGIYVQEGAKTNAHLSLSYAVTDHFAVMGSMGYMSKNVLSLVSGSYSDIGFGYYKKLRYNIVFESYMGYGYGTLNNYEFYESQAKYHKYFNQSSLTLKSNDHFFESVISLRTSGLRTNLYNLNEGELVYYDPIIKDPNSYLIEPSIALRYGFSDFKVEFFIIRSIDLTHKSKAVFSQNSAGISFVYLMKFKE
jgi:hypothetical protein